ncbi:hypothetical protein COR50_20610 [Chitinophaga caeni]|uniref:RHS repeat-associated core domain-containing protein n=1 Tax=Chitinophaga caeni TaxID=2029983 RepID=A0A291QZM9_9BACT|nr:hypothetical protein COR50_20610 [Chitinophaga caeni]
MKREGNQQDCGMRVYDPRLGRFLSVDPLTSLYAFYSPYHFAGNTTINAIDLDGMEPTGNVMDVNRQGQRTVFEHGERFLLDRNWIFAQPYIINVGIMKGAQSYHFYWWKDNEWQAFRPGQNMHDLAEGMGKVTLGATTTVAVGMIARALIGSGTWIYSAAIQYYRYTPTIAAAGRFGAELLDESGTIGVQNAGYSHLVNYGASRIRKFITMEEGALFQVEKFKQVITGGGEGLKKLLADPIYAVEYAGKTYILDDHNRLKAFSDLEKSVDVTLLSVEEATKSYKDKMAYIINGEFKIEIKDDF